MDLNTNINVLIIDDFPTMRRIVKNLLKQLGYENVDEAEHGAEALKKLKMVIFKWLYLIGICL